MSKKPQKKASKLPEPTPSSPRPPVVDTPVIHFPECVFTAPHYRILKETDFTLPGSSQSRLNVAANGVELKLPSYESSLLSKSTTVLNCGGSIVANAVKKNLIAISCADNEHGFILPHRDIDKREVRFPSPVYSNVITLYKLEENHSVTTLAHLIHHHGYATKLCWLEEGGEEVLGVLACLFVDGSFEILSVGSK